MARHGTARILQMENQKRKIVGFKQSGINKKISNLSIGQLRNMFPAYAHLPENELRKLAIERIGK